MNIQPQQPISDDQELAKVLAGITAGADGAAAADLTDDIKEESSKSKDDDAKVVTITPTDDSATAGDPGIDKIEATIATEEPIVPASAPVASTGLESIKHDALNELRPLVDKLNISAEEKFDTYLLIIRSTDDASLVGPAFEAARGIADESGKAQALLEIVKEIDYLSNPQKTAA